MRSVLSTSLGIDQSHIVGRGLAAMKVKVDEVISSPLARAAETAAIVAEEIGHVDKIILDDLLRPQGTYSEFEQLLARHGDKEAIMVVGHNPSMTEFINRLVFGNDAEGIELKKGAIAKVDREPDKLGVLKWSMPPKVMRALQQASAKSSRPKTVSK